MEARQILLMGDIHGQSWQIANLDREPAFFVENYFRPVLVLLGDSGLNYWGNEKDIALKEKLSEFYFDYFVIRGNHDRRPEKALKNYHYELFFDNRVIVEDEFPNIKYALDGYDYYLQTMNEMVWHTMVIGGGYSVDGDWRLCTGKLWFPDEQLTDQEMEDIEDYIDYLDWNVDTIDLFLTHTCPRSYIPVEDKDNWCGYPIDKTMEDWLENIRKKNIYAAWAFGHFHTNKRIDRKTFAFGDNGEWINLEAFVKENKE